MFGQLCLLGNWHRQAINHMDTITLDIFRMVFGL